MKMLRFLALLGAAFAGGFAADATLDKVNAQKADGSIQDVVRVRKLELVDKAGKVIGSWDQGKLRILRSPDSSEMTELTDRGLQAIADGCRATIWVNPDKNVKQGAVLSLSGTEWGEILLNGGENLGANIQLIAAAAKSPSGHGIRSRLGFDASPTSNISFWLYGGAMNGGYVGIETEPQPVVKTMDANRTVTATLGKK